MGFNSAFKGLNFSHCGQSLSPVALPRAMFSSTFAYARGTEPLQLPPHLPARQLRDKSA